MKIYNWHDLFYQKILSRGWNYFRDGAVENLSRSGNRLCATVLGSEEYEVEIIMDGEHVFDLACTCPFAEDGELCKHMAAVLYAAEDADVIPEQLENASLRNHMSKAEACRQIIGALPVEQLRELLLKLCSESDAVRNQILSLYPAPIPPTESNQVKRKIDRLTDRMQDYDNFIDYDHAYLYTQELQEILEEEIPPFVAAGRIMDAFDLMCYAFRVFSAQEMDDSDGGSYELLEYCKNLWTEQIAHSGSSVQEQLYDRLLLLAQESDIFGADIEDFCYTTFRSEPLMRQMLERIDGQLIAFAAQHTDSDSSYRVGALACHRLSLMEKLGLPEAQQDAFRRTYFHCRPVREAYTEQMIQSGNLTGAAAVLRECMAIDAGNPVLCTRYSNRLIALCKEAGDQSGYAEALKNHLLSFPQSSMEQVHALKAVITPEQWRSFLPELLANCFGTPICEHLLFEEKYYDVLLAHLTQTGTPRSCMQFLTELAQEYPERTTKCFSGLIAKEMESATSPKAYRTAAEYLTNLSRLPNGQAAAQELAHTWRQKWPRRRSLMNALSELGF